MRAAEVLSQLCNLRCQRGGQWVCIGSVINHKHLGHAIEFGRNLGDGLAGLGKHGDRDFADLAGAGQRLGNGSIQHAVGVLGDEEDVGH